MEETEEIIIEKTEEIIIEKTEEIIEGTEYSNRGLLKNQRNLILSETDKYLMPDYPITPENLIIVKEYRQKLRDFTLNNYILPDKPEFVITMN
jgi:hypothetical protein